METTINYPTDEYAHCCYTGISKNANDAMFHAIRVDIVSLIKRSYHRVSYAKAQAILKAIHEKRDLTNDEHNL